MARWSSATRTSAEALNRDVYSMDKTCIKTGDELPGRAVISEGGTTMDAPGLRMATTTAGNVYWFYKHSFGRDSYDKYGRCGPRR